MSSAIMIKDIAPTKNEDNLSKTLLRCQRLKVVEDENPQLIVDT